MEVKVSIQSTTIIQPSNIPHHHHHRHHRHQILPLSHLDTDSNLHSTFRYFRVYATTPTPQNHPFQVITAALSSVLAGGFHPLTGTLRPTTCGRLELACEPNRGVPVVQAYVDRSLESLNFLDDPDEALSEALVPDPDPVEALESPMVLQVTVFGCGGYVLGSAVHGALCDGLGASMFFNAVAQLARGGPPGRSMVEPVWGRASLLGPRDPPRVEFPFREILSLGTDFSPYLQRIGKVARECFDIKEEWLDRFKSYLLDRSGSHFTTFEALGAFIWRARVKASKLPKEEIVKFAYLMNTRKVVKPSLPEGYWGNACAHMYVQLTAGDLVEQPIWETAKLIKKSKYEATDEYVRSYIDFQELNYDKGISAGTEVSGFTDWRHLGHSSVDFGSGGPVTVFPVAKQFLGSFEPCFFLPKSERESEGEKFNGFKVLVNLREYAMDEFKLEMGKFSTQMFA